MAVKNGAVTPAIPPPAFLQHDSALSPCSGARPVSASLPLYRAVFLQLSLFLSLSLFYHLNTSKEKGERLCEQLFVWGDLCPGEMDVLKNELDSGRKKNEWTILFELVIRQRQMEEILKQQWTASSQMERNTKTQRARTRASTLHHSLVLWRLWYITRRYNGYSMS